MSKGSVKETVLFVHGINEIGGAERDLLAILDHLSYFGYRAIVACPEAGPLVDELLRRGAETRCVKMPAWRKLFSYPQRAEAIRSLHQVITSDSPSLIHVNDIWWVPQTLRANEGNEIPVVAHVRQEIEPDKVRRYGLDRADLVIAVSRQVQQSLESGGVQGERLRTCYSGLDVDTVPACQEGSEVRRQLGIPEGALLLGTVGNRFPRKGYEVMLKALPKILAQRSEVYYLIIGGGDEPYARKLKSLVNDLSLESRVRFTGFQQSIFPFLATLDMYVHPALMEGFGIAVLEAMAMGKPVVATLTGGVPEIVVDGETGLLVPPGSSDALMGAVMELLQDPKRCCEMGERGRNRVEEHFSSQAMMQQLTSSYQTLLGCRIPMSRTTS